MADVIEINMSTLDLDAGEMADELQALRDEMNKAYTSVQELDMMWNGPANDAFNKAFADDQLLMENMCNTMQGLIDFMTNASSEYKTCEANVSAEIDAIKI